MDTLVRAEAEESPGSNTKYILSILSIPMVEIADQICCSVVDVGDHMAVVLLLSEVKLAVGSVDVISDASDS